MNEKLQQAIAAARSGQSREAQLLLTQSLKENPKETQAWFLLSTLVESPQKKNVYLKKVLALDPQHSKAQQMLARLQEKEEVEEVETAVSPPAPSLKEQPIPISEDATDYLTQEKGDTVPNWLADEENLQWEQMPAIANDIETEEIPDWLQDEVSDTWSEDSDPPETEPVIPPSAKTPPPAISTPETSSTDHMQQKQYAYLTRILIALIIVAVFISGTLIYLIWQML